MQPTKTPTSSLSGSHTTHFPPLHLITTTMTAVELLAKRVWYRTRARIERVGPKSASSETSAARSSTASTLPQEIVEMIIAYLIHDLRSLRTCTLTCHSWYIAAVPRLHHTLVAPTDSRVRGRKSAWPKPLRHNHRLGLLPLVKTFWVCGSRSGQVEFSSKMLNRCNLRQFSTLTNVQQLKIDYLDIPSFMPRIRRYFGHFSPTVQYLALRAPKGSCRQIIYFIGLFPHLENLKLVDVRSKPQEEPTEDLTLIPPFVPPLRGRLMMVHFTRVGFLKDMIVLFGGIRFCYMNLFDVDGMRLLLDACAKTLKTVALYPTDPRGEQPSLKRVTSSQRFLS